MRNRPLFYGLCGPFKAYYASRVPIEIGQTLCMCAKLMWRSQTYASLFPATERASEGGGLRQTKKGMRCNEEWRKGREAKREADPDVSKTATDTTAAAAAAAA